MQGGEARAQRGERPRSPRSSVSTTSRSDSVVASASCASRPSIRARESRRCSPTVTVGAVMSAVASWRVRTSPICEKAARASPSLPLGISSSNSAPAPAALPFWIEERRTMPLLAWTASKTSAAASSTGPARRRAPSRPSVRPGGWSAWPRRGRRPLGRADAAPPAGSAAPTEPVAARSARARGLRPSPRGPARRRRRPTALAEGAERVVRCPGGWRCRSRPSRLTATDGGRDRRCAATRDAAGGQRSGAAAAPPRAARGGERRRLQPPERRGNPAAAQRVELGGEVGVRLGAGSARRSARELGRALFPSKVGVIAGLPQLVEHTVKPGAGVRLAGRR